MITIIPEDNTGLDTANSYVDLDYVDTFADNMGLQDWYCGTEEERKIALIRSAQFIDLRFFKVVCGSPLNPDQGLMFPRMTAGQLVTIPTALKKAQAYAAIMWVMNGHLDLDANADAGRVVQSESVSLGGGAISESKTYATVAANKQISKNTYAMVDAYMYQIPCIGRLGSIFIQSSRG